MGEPFPCHRPPTKLPGELSGGVSELNAWGWMLGTEAIISKLGYSIQAWVHAEASVLQWTCSRGPAAVQTWSLSPAPRCSAMGMVAIQRRQELVTWRSVNSTVVPESTEANPDSTRQRSAFASPQTMGWVSNQFPVHQGHPCTELHGQWSLPNLLQCLSTGCLSVVWFCHYMLLWRRRPWVRKGTPWTAEAGLVDTCPSKPLLLLCCFQTYLKFPFM